jgi:hypothetical protein
MTAWVGTTSVTLSNSNLTATKTNNSDRTVLSDTSYSSGKRVFAITLGSSVTNLGPGLARPGSNAGEYAGDNATSLSIISGTGIFYNGGATTPVPTWSASDKCFIAVDFGASRMWWKDGAGGTWTGTASGDPDAGTNGYNISALQNSGALLPALGMFSSGTSATLDPTASGHGLSTFTPWDSSSTQAITGALFANSQTFYGATVGRGAVNISAALFSNAQTFYGATVAASYAIAGGKFDNSQTFYQATVTPGPAAISGALFTNGQTFYQATVAPGSVDIGGALYTNPQTFYGASIVQDGADQTITAALFTNVQAFFGATIAQEAPPVADAQGGGFWGGRVTKRFRDEQRKRLKQALQREAEAAELLDKAYDKANGIAQAAFEALEVPVPQTIPASVRTIATNMPDRITAARLNDLLRAIETYQRQQLEEEEAMILLLLAA